MERKEYKRPYMSVELFTPNEFVAGCTMTVTLAGSKLDHVYHDNNPKNGYYNSGEELTNNWASTITIDIAANKSAGYLIKAKYAGTGIAVGDYVLKNLTSLDYYSHHQTNGKYSTNNGYICALISTSQTTYYYNNQRITSISNKNAS